MSESGRFLKYVVQKCSDDVGKTAVDDEGVVVDSEVEIFVDIGFEGDSEIDGVAAVFGAAVRKIPASFKGCSA